MSIELHCSHCNQLIKAPEESAGKMGKCPHCDGVNYIPRPVSAEDELDLAPLDENEERQRKQALLEDAAYQRRLLNERAAPGDAGKPAARSAATSQAGAKHKVSAQSAVSPSGMSSKEVALLIVRFVDAMSAGKLEQADEYASKLAVSKSAAIAALDDIARDDTGGYGLPPLPRPVLIGFLKQLRTRLG